MSPTIPRPGLRVNPPRRRRGLTLIEAVVVLAIISLLIGLVLSAVQRSRAAAARITCADRLRQLGLAAHNYHGAHGRLPPGLTSDDAPDPYPYMSWLTRLLPYLEEDALWAEAERAYKADRNFLTPAHAVRAAVVPQFLCPADGRIRAPASRDITGHPVAYTSYLGVLGRNAGVTDGLLYLNSKHRLTDATDGTANTLLAGERPPSRSFGFGWWYAGYGQRKNGDAEFVLGTRTRGYSRTEGPCEDGPYHFTAGRFDDPCDAYHFWSPHPGGAHFLFADGSVRFLPYSADEIMPALSTRAGGETVDLP